MAFATSPIRVALGFAASSPWPDQTEHDMNPLDSSLNVLTAADLMSREVLTIPAEMSLRGAGQLLMRARVSGAPVVDEQGTVIGVLSTTDFLKMPRAHRTRESCVCSEWQVLDFCAVPEDTVTRYMTPDPVTVPATMPLTELARTMLDAHIHRVVVIDLARRPVGIVSSTDILAAVAHCSAAEPALG